MAIRQFPGNAECIYEEAQSVLGWLEVQSVAEEEDSTLYDLWAVLPFPDILILREIHSAVHEERNHSVVLWSRVARRICAVCEPYPWCRSLQETRLQSEVKFGPAALAEASTSYGDGASHADSQRRDVEDEGIDAFIAAYPKSQTQLLQETHRLVHSGADACAKGHPFRHKAESTYTCDGCLRDLSRGEDVWHCGVCGVGFCCECRQKKQIEAPSDVPVKMGLVKALQRKGHWRQAEEIVQDLAAQVENHRDSVAMAVLRERGKDRQGVWRNPASGERFQESV